MSRRIAALLLAVALAGCGPAGGATYYVDWEGGDDARPGTSPQAAWKHAPGDAEASGRAASADLAAGDTVIFRAGVPYRGAITLRWSGTAAAPITYTGLGWGEGMGIIDGSAPVTAARACASAADCGGAGEWQKLWRVEFAPPPATARNVPFGREGLYWRSQLPVPVDPFYSDDNRGYAVTSLASLPTLQTGVLADKQLAAAVAQGGGIGMELAFWTFGNAIRRTPITGSDGSTLNFNAGDIRFYDNRDGRVALMDSFAGLASPGTFLTLQPGVILLWPRPGDDASTLSVGTGRHGIDFRNASHIRIDGLRFRNFVAGPGERTAGMPVGNSTAGGRDIQIRGSWFGPMSLENGGGVVRPNRTEGLRLLSSRIEDIQFGSGIRTLSINSDLNVQGNVFRRLGRTAITYFSVNGGEISGNFLADIQGIHGNAITAYLANRNILIANNCVVNSSRPLTFHGDKTPDIPNNIVIRDNIFIATPDGQGGISSWGADTNGVTITGNVTLGNRMGILLNQRDSNIVVTGNDTNGVELRGTARPDWKIADNGEKLTRAQVSKGTYNEEGCETPGTIGTFRTTRTPR